MYRINECLKDDVHLSFNQLKHVINWRQFLIEDYSEAKKLRG